MPFAYLVPAALSLFGANQQSSAAESAAAATAAASDRAAKLQYQMFQQQQAAQERALAEQRALQEPYRQAGLAGQNRLMELMGLRMPAPSSMTGAPSVTARTGIAPTLRSEDEIRNALVSQYTTGGGQVEYGREGGMREAPSVVNEANLAAAIQGAQSQEQTALNAYRAQQSQAQQSQQMQQTAPSADFGKYARDFGTADFQQDPGYAFRLSEGQKALDRQAAARGGLISGGALKAATRYGQEMGSQEYQNAYNRYQTNRANQLQPLGNLMSSGQSAASNQGTAAGQYGTAMSQAAGQYGANVGNLYTQQGANQGNALLAGAQARTSAYGDIAKLYGQTNPQFGGMFGGGGSSGGGSAIGYSDPYARFSYGSNA
jgi:hypothetical protein